jgi:hypothetical protein
MADSNGRFTLILPIGQVTSALAELTGIDVAQVRCGVAQFNINRDDPLFRSARVNG